jgi:phospholipase/lecithinase/hemolysin
MQMSNLFVFGDSLSDGGNSGIVSRAATGGTFTYPPPPYYNGQFSNGPVAVEYLWNLYSPSNPFALKPSLSGGTNYAIGGATTGTVNYNTVSASVPPPLQPAYSSLGAQWQLDTFAAQAPTFDPATSLFVVWLFPNDVFYTLDTGNLSGQVNGSPGGPNLVANGIANILATVQTLAALGAEHFLVPNMPDLGTTPFGRSLAPADTVALSLLSNAFNLNLAAALTALDGAMAAEIVQADVAAMLAAIEANPAAFGYTNTTDACVYNLQNGLCNPSNWHSWLFWDEVHPTTSTHEYLAMQFAAAVPEPASGALLALAAMPCVWLIRRRKN